MMSPYPGRSCQRQKYRSNNEWQEVSRGRSSKEVSVMEMEQRTEQVYQLLKSHLRMYTKTQDV